MTKSDRRKSFDARLAGRQKYRARIIVISENQRLDSHVEDRIDDKQRARRVSRALHFCKQISRYKKKIIGNRSGGRIVRR